MFIEKVENCIVYIAILVLFFFVILMALGHKAEMKRGPKGMVK